MDSDLNRLHSLKLTANAENRPFAPKEMSSSNWFSGANMCFREGRITHSIHVWYIYLHFTIKNQPIHVLVGKYTISTDVWVMERSHG